MIFYFSGTGNTRWLAKELARETNDELVPIGDATVNGKFEYSIGKSDRVGFCFPVHGWRPPFIVRNFIKQLILKGYDDECHFCYAFATCGDDVGLTFEYLRDDLQSVGLRLDSVFSLIMPETYNFPFIDQIDTPDKAEQKKMAARGRLAHLLPDVVNRRRGIKKINPSRWPRINSVLLGGFFLKYWVTDAKFTVDADACQRCGLCSRVCPVGNIDYHEGIPVWRHNGLCTTCFACYHHCPAHAIDFDRRTRGKRQYYFKDSTGSVGKGSSKALDQ